MRGTPGRLTGAKKNRSLLLPCSRVPTFRCAGTAAKWAMALEAQLCLARPAFSCQPLPHPRWAAGPEFPSKPGYFGLQTAQKDRYAPLVAATRSQFRYLFISFAARKAVSFYSDIPLGYGGTEKSLPEECQIIFIVAITDTRREIPIPADKAPQGQKVWPEGKLQASHCQRMGGPAGFNVPMCEPWQVRRTI
jgi:hypothetical protein